MNKHVKLFEEFTATPKEAFQMYKKYEDTLKEIVGKIEFSHYNFSGEVKDTYKISPQIRLIGSDTDFGKKLPHSFTLTCDNNRNLLYINIYKKDNGHRLVISKPSGYVVSEESIYNIDKLLDSVSNMMGGFSHKDSLINILELLNSRENFDARSDL